MDDCRHIPLVETTRGDTVESIHYGSVAIAFYGRKDAISIGDSKHPFFLRSSAKPFQALAFIEKGGSNQFDFSPQDIAIICASHSGTDSHVIVLSRLQKKIGITEEMLQCGIILHFIKIPPSGCQKTTSHYIQIDIIAQENIQECLLLQK